MRTRRRIAALVVSAAALGVGFIALPSSAAAAPPVVPTCAFPATAGSDSCGTIRTTAVAAPIGTAYENIKLGIRVRSQFSPTTSETTSVNLKFDDDIALNLAGIPSCPASELTGKNISAAYEQCGPGADGNPPSEGNAFLSAAGNSFKRDYHGEDEEGQQMPILTVFQKDSEGVIRLSWASELLFEPSDPGQDPRHCGTVEPMWTLLDLTPGGRPAAYEQFSYSCCNGETA